MTFNSPEDMPPGLRKLYEQQVGQKVRQTAAKQRLAELEQQSDSAQPKESKYHAKPTEIQLDSGETVRFDSRKEAKRWEELQIMQQMGKIYDLRRQVKYELIPPQKAEGYSERGVYYIADFVYKQNGREVVEDTKSPITRKNPVFVIKRKLMLWRYGITLKIS